MAHLTTVSTEAWGCTPEVAARFFAKVNKHGGLPPEAPHLGECWLWTKACVGPEGFKYGVFSIRRGVARRAHRWSFEYARGPIPEGRVLDHLCRRSLCVRPTHLEPVTQGTNVRRGLSHTNGQAAQVLCLRQHPFGYVDAQGKRRCRECDRIRQAAYEARKKAKAAT